MKLYRKDQMVLKGGKQPPNPPPPPRSVKRIPGPPGTPPPYNPDLEIIGYLEEPEKYVHPLPPVEGGTYFMPSHHTDNWVLLEVLALLVMFAGGVLIGAKFF